MGQVCDNWKSSLERCLERQKCTEFRVHRLSGSVPTRNDDVCGPTRTMQLSYEINSD